MSAANAETSRREVILDAALACFLTNSVAGTTIDDVRRHSGASVGSIYHFFGSKEGLAVELYLDTLRDYFDTYLAALRSSRSARGGIERSVRAHLRWVSSHEDRARYVFHWREPEVIDQSREAVEQLNASFYAQAAEWLRPHVEHGHIKSMPPRLCQALWMGPSAEYARLWLTRTTHTSRLRDAESALARAAWESVKGQNA